MAYPIVASGATGTGLGNYDIHYAAGSLTVNQKSLTITADDRNKTYGDTLALGHTAFSTPVGGLVNGDTVASVTLTSAGAAEIAVVQAGGYPIVASGATGTGLGNYDIHYAAGSLTVNQKSLTITADDRNKTYGDTLALGHTAFSTPVGGLVNGDTVASVTLTSAGAAEIAVVQAGGYPIVASGATGTGLGNYDIHYAAGTLTVNKRDLTVTARSRTKTFGAIATLTGSEFTTSGLANTDTVTSATLTSTGAPASAAVGKHWIKVSAAVGAGLSNYTITYVDGELWVQYAWDGFLQPINDTAHDLVTESKFKLGQTIPVKFDIKDANGNLVTQLGSPRFTRSDNLGSCDRDASLDTLPSVIPDGGTTYSSNGGHYQYNWSTKGLTSGEYRIFAHLADSTSQSVYICLTK